MSGAGENDRREHYVSVGKSKLQKTKDVALGPQYRGSKVSRGAILRDEDEDDPFARGFDDDDSLQNEEGDSDEDEDEDEDVNGYDDMDAEKDTPCLLLKKVHTYKVKFIYIVIEIIQK